MANSHLLIIGSVWPEPQSSAAGRRMMQLISVFQENGWQITFASAAAQSNYAVDFNALNIKKATVEMNSSSFDEFVQNLQPAAVMFDRFITEEQFGWRVAEYCPDAIRILDTEDLHCLRKARAQAVKEGQSFKQTNLLSSDTAKREIASIYRCDISLIISEAEMLLLQALFNVDKDLLHYLPFMLDPIDEEIIYGWPSLSERTHFVSIGNFRHPPNADSIGYLKDEIWPQIHGQLPEAEFHAYGAYPSSKMQELHQPEKGFYIKGRAEDAKEVVRRHKVCVAPLRFGAGLKGKLTEAMHCGTPSVTTDIGAEGLNSNLDWSGTIANKSDEIVSAAIELYQNEERWHEAQENGIKIINKRFLKKQHDKSLINQVSSIQSNLDGHRSKNFTGSMLMQQTTNASKYMARWIEAKNQN